MHANKKQRHHQISTKGHAILGLCCLLAVTMGLGHLRDQPVQANTVLARAGRLEEAWEGQFYLSWEEEAVTAEIAGRLDYLVPPDTNVRRGQAVARSSSGSAGAKSLLVAPIAGLVRHNGRDRTSAGDIVFTVRKTATAYLTAAWPERRLRRLSPGDTVQLRLPLAGEGERTVLAKVAKVTAAVDGVAMVTFSTGQTYELLTAPPKLNGSVIVRSEGFGTIVPVAALRQRDGADGVLLQQPDSHVWVPVQVVARTLTEALVDGLTPGVSLIEDVPPN